MQVGSYHGSARSVPGDLRALCVLMKRLPRPTGAAARVEGAARRAEVPVGVLRPQQAVERPRHRGRLDQRGEAWDALDRRAVRAPFLPRVRAVLGRGVREDCLVERWLELIRLQDQEPLPEELLHLRIAQQLEVVVPRRRRCLRHTAKKSRTCQMARRIAGRAADLLKGDLSYPRRCRPRHAAERQVENSW